MGNVHVPFLLGYECARWRRGDEVPFHTQSERAVISRDVKYAADPGFDDHSTFPGGDPDVAGQWFGAGEMSLESYVTVAPDLHVNWPNPNVRLIR